MCLIVRQEELPKNIFQKIFKIEPEIKHLVAKKDIVCYKLYRETDIPGVVEAPYRLTKHLVGKPQPNVQLTWTYTPNNRVLSVEAGYHSFIKPIIKHENIGLFQEFLIIKKCIIPKGSVYYIGNAWGTRDGYVSNQLIIL